MPKSRERLRAGLAGAIGTLLLFSLTACPGDGNSDTTAQAKEASQASSGANKLLDHQQLHQYDYSQYRQSVQDIEDSMAAAVTTTTFFFLPMQKDPYKVCPSIGFPISGGTQLSNPWQVSDGHGIDGTGTGNVAIGQMDPIGVYLPSSAAATFVLCVRADGTIKPSVAEPSVHTEVGPAVWDYDKHVVIDTGAASFQFKKVTGDTTPKCPDQPQGLCPKR
jgi:hypothetical protein